jgi:Rrf2 family protein
MSSFVRISEASSLAFHTATYLAQHHDRVVSTREMARTLDASENHLSKVLQRLVHAGLVRSTRGPSGGFQVGPDWRRTRLIQVYEAIEGPLTPSRCLLGAAVCKGSQCPLGLVVHKTDEAVRKCLRGTTLAEMARRFRPGA